MTVGGEARPLARTSHSFYRRSRPSHCHLPRRLRRRPARACPCRHGPWSGRLARLREAHRSKQRQPRAAAALQIRTQSRRVCLADSARALPFHSSPRRPGSRHRCLERPPKPVTSNHHAATHGSRKSVHKLGGISHTPVYFYQMFESTKSPLNLASCLSALAPWRTVQPLCPVSRATVVRHA